MAVEKWQNLSPGDLSIALPEVTAGNVEQALAQATAASAQAWSHTLSPERIDRLRSAQQALAAAKDDLAHGIALETGKPITEAHGEVGAVIAKIDLTIDDATQHLADCTNLGGPHASLVRQAARGPAVVIGPFNFPLHLGHGATFAHLLAGNPVIYKPSPLAANVAARYGGIMTQAFPPGVFQIIQGGGAEGEALCLDPRVRAVCFTGSVPVGRVLAQKLAGDFSKDLALELGGSNALIVCADADLDLAAQAAADGACLTAGQRCNATSRVIVERAVAAEFERKFLEALSAYQPGDPTLPATKLGPVISTAAVARYGKLLADLPWDMAPARARRARGRRQARELGSPRGHSPRRRWRGRCRVFRAHCERPYRRRFGSCRSPAKRHTIRPHRIDLHSPRRHLPHPRLATGGRQSLRQPAHHFLSLHVALRRLARIGQWSPGRCRGFIRFTTREQAVQWTSFSNQ